MNDPLTIDETREWLHSCFMQVTYDADRGPFGDADAYEWADHVVKRLAIREQADEIKDLKAQLHHYKTVIAQSERYVREMTETPKGDIPLSLLAQHAPLLAAENLRLRNLLDDQN